MPKIFSDKAERRAPFTWHDDLAEEFKLPLWPYPLNAIWTLHAASIAYSALLRDLANMDPTCVLEDSCDLVDLIWYFHEGPMKLGYIEAGKAFQQQKLNIDCYKTIREGRRKLQDQLLITEVNRRGEENGLRYALGVNSHSFDSLSPMSPVELLIRILGQVKGPQTLGGYDKSLLFAAEY